MCLVVVSWRQHAKYPLIVAGNRDEFHARPTDDAHWWADQPKVFAGRDLQAGGTWLAVHRAGRFATVTNYREARPTRRGLRSRGGLVSDFVLGEQSSVDYLAAIDGAAFAGFNLLVSDGESLAYLSNRDPEVRILEPGLYGLSNELLDAPWDKVVRSKKALASLIDNDTVNESQLLRLLSDKSKAPASSIDSGNLSFARAHTFSAPFIVSPDYGTRSSSIVLLDHQGEWRIQERRYDARGEATGDSAIAFQEE